MDAEHDGERPQLRARRRLTRRVVSTVRCQDSRDGGGDFLADGLRFPVERLSYRNRKYESFTAASSGETTMAIVSMPGCPPSQSLVEYTVGAAQNECIYPGILQCLSITGFSVHGLLGTHVSPGISEDDLDMTFNVLRSGGAIGFPMWYVVGNFPKHFADIKIKKWNSMTKIAKEIRSRLNKSASIYMFDVSSLPNSSSGFGLDIFARHGVHGVAFSYGRAGRSGRQQAPQLINGAFLTY